MKNINILLMLISLALASSAQAETLVKVVVSTANEKASGTDAVTRAILIGDKAICEISLDEKGIDNHKRSGADLFSKSCPDLGNLTEITLWHAPYNARGEKASWKVDDVSVIYEDPSGNVVRLIADFNCWIGGSVTKPFHR